MTKYVAIDKHGDFLRIDTALGVTGDLSLATTLPLTDSEVTWADFNVSEVVTYIPAIEKRTVELVREDRGDE